jgi:uncharacterized protein YjiS (DUF1127 family)
MLQQFSHWLREWADRRRTLVAIQRLDRRLLADIGVPEDRLEEYADPRARARIIETEREDGYSRARVGASEGGFAKRPAQSDCGARKRNPVFVETV